MKRRERTRHLIELGGLVVKAKLDDLTDDDRAVLYGGLLTFASMISAPDGPATLELWRRRGRRAFEAEEALRSGDDGETPGELNAARRWRGSR